MAYQPASLACLVSSRPVKDPFLNKKGESTLGTTVKVVLWPLHTHTQVYHTHTYTQACTHIYLSGRTQRNHILLLEVKQ